MKIGIISSNGGHLFQINQLDPIFQNYDHFWIVFRGKDSEYYIGKKNVYYTDYQNARNIISFFIHCLKALIIFYKERPDILISCGAGISVPYFIMGKYIYRTKLIFIEPFDFIAYPSLTGKIINHFADLFLVQNKVQKKWYTKAKYWGSLL